MNSLTEASKKYFRLIIYSIITLALFSFGSFFATYAFKGLLKISDFIAIGPWKAIWAFVGFVLITALLLFKPLILDYDETKDISFYHMLQSILNKTHSFTFKKVLGYFGVASLFLMLIGK